MYTNTEGPHGKWFLPILWINTLIKRCHQQGAIDSVQLKNLMKIVDSYRGGFSMLFVYDWVSVPLVYTQVHPFFPSSFLLPPSPFSGSRWWP